MAIRIYLVNWIVPDIGIAIVVKWIIWIRYNAIRLGVLGNIRYIPPGVVRIPPFPTLEIR
jgi:hypothetical protein